MVCEIKRTLRSGYPRSEDIRKEFVNLSSYLKLSLPAIRGEKPKPALFQHTWFVLVNTDEMSMKKTSPKISYGVRV